MIEVAIVLGLATVALALVAIYWTKILQWGLNNLLPWMDKNLPSLSDDVREAFVRIDKVAAPVRAAAKDAWQRLRRTLLRQIAEFERQTGNRWLLRITSWVRVQLDALDPSPKVAEVRSEQIVHYDELPPEVREQLLRQGSGTYQVDITHAKDVELGLAMTT